MAEIVYLAEQVEAARPGWTRNIEFEIVRFKGETDPRIQMLVPLPPPSQAELDATTTAIEAEKAEDTNRKGRIKSNKGQGQNVPDLRDRIDDLVIEMEHKGRL